MKLLVRILFATVTLFGAVTGCMTSLDPDSETNWLARCTGDENCTGRARCLCGVCTIRCDGGSACEAGPVGSSCVSAVNFSGCVDGDETRLCVAPCKAASDCRSNQRCEAGVCVDDSPASIPVNPTGTCAATDNGARLSGPLDDPDDVWIPDCNNVLEREYWRVFVRESGSAYIVPSPEGPPQYYGSACGDPQHPLFEIVGRYSFCDLTNPDAAPLIASMDLHDALAVAHYFHEQLEFSFARGFSPQAFMEDVVAACELRSPEDSPEYATLCDRERARFESGSGTTADATYEGQGGADLAYHLNELYGIDAARQTLAIDPELCGLPSDETACSTSEALYFYNPVTAQCEVSGYGACPDNIRDFASLEACNGGCALRANFCERCDAACVTASDCSSCPLVMPQDGASCTDVGFACNFGPACGGSECECTSNGAGGATWLCLTRPC
jgi:hypothetical protein